LSSSSSTIAAPAVKALAAATGPSVLQCVTSTRRSAMRQEWLQQRQARRQQQQVVLL
jgi:hypothetical protein